MALLQSRFFIPALFVPALFLWCVVGHAEVLYKWLEPDGTLTFSPTPPGDSSIQYEKIVSGQGLGKASQANIGKEYPANSNDATQNQTNRGQRIQNATAQGHLAQGLTQNTATNPAGGNAIQRPPVEPVAARSKQKSTHCQELQKRVISLERLLQTDISNETMDNAVVQMARYQASFNQACNRAGLRQKW